MLLPFLIIGFFWLLPLRLLLHYPRYRNHPIWEIVFKDLLGGYDNGHLWFLPTLFFMLLLSLALIKICGTGIRLDIAMIIIGIGFVAVFGLAHSLVSWNTYLMQFSNYYFFFVLGFIYHRNERFFQIQHDQTVERRIPQPVAFLALAACMVAAWFNPWTPIALACSCISVLAIYLLIPLHSNAPIRLISKDSMGIYLFHSPMLYISFTFWPDINPALMILINFVGFGSIAIALTELMRRIHCGFVIGE